MSARDTLLAAVATALSGVASGRVYRSRGEQLPTLPAVIVSPLSEESGEPFLGVMDRRLTLGIDVYAKGDTPDNAADSTLDAVWAALAAAPNLGLGDGVQLDMSHSIEWGLDDYDHGRAQLRVAYTYRTTIGSM